MKRIFAILLAALLATTMIACTEEPKEEEKKTEEQVSDNGDTTDVVTDENVDKADAENKDAESENEDAESAEDENVTVELPEIDPEAGVPAAGTEEENVPAVMPEVDPEINVEIDTPAADPEVDVEIDTPAADPEVDVEIDTPAADPEIDVEIDTPAAEPEQIPEENDDASAEDDSETQPDEAPAEGGIDELYVLAETLYAGINPEDMPMVGTMELTSENFEYSAFVPYKDTYLAVENMPMMGSTPHSVVIVKTASEAEAAQLAQDMLANANPRKWICVSARSVKSAYKGNMAILVMTSVDVMPDYETIDEEAAEEMSNAKSEERAQLIIDNFLANA